MRGKDDGDLNSIRIRVPLSILSLLTNTFDFKSNLMNSLISINRVSSDDSDSWSSLVSVASDTGFDSNGFLGF